MANYHAVVKQFPDSIPQRMLLSGDTVMQAVKAMCDMMHVSSTVDIAEFEILEVLSLGKYRMAARKNIQEEKNVQQAAPAIPPLNLDEPTYKSYTVRTA